MRYHCLGFLRHATRCLQFSKFSISSRKYLKMSQVKTLRHAQTQHVAGDVENIIVHKASLFTAVPEVKETAESKESQTTSSDNDTATDSQCVWFHEVTPPSPTADNKTNSVNKDKLPLAEKRKAEESENIINKPKKPKMDSNALSASRPGFTDERFDETSYYFENGLRKVYPYFFTFTTFTKGRWVGEKILDVFAREFRAHLPEEYERSIADGSLTVNYEKVPIDYRLKHNDLLSNTVHRHEVPVTAQSIKIVHIDDNIVVVDKPASIPVHPCGRYRHNTVVFILAKEYNLKNLRTIHRLDRLTSGLLMFGRNSNLARQMEKQIRNREVQKEYVCRVEGTFPDGVLECKEPIDVVSYKIGVCRVSPSGKDCTTIFQKISENDKTSVVLCKPRTGRMHQIRVHLQYLGFPIVNDLLYNHEVFGPIKGRGGDMGGKTNNELIKDLMQLHNAENWLGIDGDVPIQGTIKDVCENDLDEIATTTTESIVESTASGKSKDVICDILPSSHTIAQTISRSVQTRHESPDMAFNPQKLTKGEHCHECKHRFRDPKPKDMTMYLHAWKYKGEGWGYETCLPDWASADWVEPV